MKPEHTAFQNSPHANVSCTVCHIGPGADWFVKSKLNVLYQVYSTIFNKYDRPVKAPVHNLRPAKETCYTCHWPEKFFGSVERQRIHHAMDASNTAWQVRMLVKVGGGDPKQGRVEGGHWHTAAGNTTAYIATDEKRQVIPWVRLTDADGNVTIYQSEDEPELSEEEVAQHEVRTMDCIDCHNRPTHHFHPPGYALDVAITAGTIDPAIPYIKLNAMKALMGKHETEDKAVEAIKTSLYEVYPDGIGCYECHGGEPDI